MSGSAQLDALCASATLYVPPAQLARGDDPNRLLCDAINVRSPIRMARLSSAACSASSSVTSPPDGKASPFGSAFTSDSTRQVMGDSAWMPNYFVLLSQPPANASSGTEAAEVVPRPNPSPRSQPKPEPVAVLRRTFDPPRHSSPPRRLPD